MGGIASPAVFEGGRRIGYDLLDLQTGLRRQLARVDEGSSAATRVGRYAFDDAAIADGNACIEAAVRRRLSIIAVDEIGPLEFRGEGWAPALALALEKCVPDCELILTVRPTMADQLATRFASPFWEGARRRCAPWDATQGTFLGGLGDAPSQV